MALGSGINPAIEACYDAVLDSARWPDALQKLANSLDASSCVIRCCDQSHPFATDRRNKPHVAPDSTEHMEFSNLWLERVEGAPDPHLDWPRPLARPATSFIVEDEITTPQEPARLPYYQEIAGPGNREWCLSIGSSLNALAASGGSITADPIATLGISRETARGQLKAIFAKTDTR